MIPIMDGKLALGTYQLDGPRQRTLFMQIVGQ